MVEFDPGKESVFAKELFLPPNLIIKQLYNNKHRFGDDKNEYLKKFILEAESLLEDSESNVCFDYYNLMIIII